VVSFSLSFALTPAHSGGKPKYGVMQRLAMAGWGGALLRVSGSCRGDSGLSATEGISIAVIFLLLFIFKVNINIPDGGINSLINIQQENNKRVAYGIFLLHVMTESNKATLG
jgi:putative copper export protein